MRAIVLDGRNGVELSTRPEPTPGPGQVVVAPAAVGICGTDLHLVDGSYATGRYSVVPGHEFAGTVTAVGSGVTGLAEGDLVGVDPNVPCGECRWCRVKAVNLCVRLEPVGVTRDGACADRVLVPARVTYRLPAGVDATAGALVEPLACVLHALDRAPTVTDRDVLIYGAGSIGLLMAAMLRQRGAGRIQIVEPHEVRRDAALRLGADAAAAGSADLDLRDGAELVIEASGHPAAITDALDRIAVRGTLVQMGVTAPDTTVPLHPFEVFEKEITVLGSNSLADCYPAAAEQMAGLTATLRPLVTHTFPLESYAEALAAAASPEALKVHVMVQ
ncbi:alcohol dehydrogenase [Paractinoplanes abujensis]|uniref:2-desacetyl-2-hydroxyethyl bacteriochlorophyllide A dehydrogenase n=1 Tax=Paractinoplanes abujensis TaxID=882441 RepID=A0A7W7G261_9ACTN|nr:alcohol dehydrogenase catalytic domain-containing protein [Actinoplanes abujensis]MBB4693369.1 2-desacetyl-2-hydroxyethyl bacteriochlorophyllide A dehydrogenase [Actinoplanes abujensis]GID24573.1 alcohol dehydrogenase [Actinoplanes abujensis]